MKINWMVPVRSLKGFVLTTIKLTFSIPIVGTATFAYFFFLGCKVTKRKITQMTWIADADIFNAEFAIFGPVKNRITICGDSKDEDGEPVAIFINIIYAKITNSSIKIRTIDKKIYTISTIEKDQDPAVLAIFLRKIFLHQKFA
jgi:hypothetical protein